MQKQPFEGFFKKGFMRNFPLFKKYIYICAEIPYNKVELCGSATSLKSNI